MPIPTIASKTTDAYNRLLTKIPKRYRASANEQWRGLLLALAEGDGYIDYTVEAVRSNLVTITAQGKFLDWLGSGKGVERGQGSSILDNDYRNIIPIVGTTRKMVTSTLLSLLDQIYGPYACHASVTCSAPEPYYLLNGWTLSVMADGTQRIIKFQSSDFDVITAATAQEVATAITERTSGALIGSVITNNRTGENFLNIRTATVGPQGFVQVLGGQAQSSFKFPTVRPTNPGIATWSITRGEGADMVYTVLSGISPGMLAAGVSVGDWVTISPLSGFNAANTGSFPITSITATSFTATNPDGVIQSSVANGNPGDLSFYRPDQANILLQSSPATVLATDNRELTVVMPVNSPIVKKTLLGGAHVHGAVTTASSATSTTLTLANSIGFPASGAIVPVGARHISKSTVNSVATGQVTLVSAENWPSQGSFYCPVTDVFYYYSGLSGDTLTGVQPQPPTSIEGAPARYVERYTYSSITGTTLQGVFPDPTSLVNRNVATAGAISSYVGAYLYDPKAPFIVSSLVTNLTENVVQGTNRTLVMTGALPAGWPESGYVAFEYGTNNQEAPVKYSAVVGTSAIIVDPSHTFKSTHLSGTTVRLVRQVGPYIPRTDGSDYAVYLTSSAGATDQVALWIKDLVAAGVVVVFQIGVPPQQWPVLPNLYTTNPTATQIVPPI